MPYMADAARAAGTRGFTSDPHNGGPCDCKGAAALLRHRVLPPRDQRRYGNTRPIGFNRRRRIEFTSEGGGTVATCMGCGWLMFDADAAVVRKRSAGHEKCPERKRKRK